MNELQDKAERVQATLDVLRVLEDAIARQVRWFAEYSSTNDARSAIVRETSMDVQTLITVFEDYLDRAKKEQDEIVDILVGTQRTAEPGGAA